MDVDAVERYPLGRQQRRLFRLHQAETGAPFHTFCVVAIDGPAREDALRRAVMDLVDRHEILRTTFRPEPGLTMPVQVVDPEMMPRWHDAAGSGSTVRSLLGDLVRAPHRLEGGPCLEARLVVTGPQSHLLLLRLPALCADNASLPILVRDLCRAYESDFEHRFRGAPALQYVDIAAWQEEILEADDAETGRAFWRQQTRHPDRDPVLVDELPGDGPFSPQSLTVELAAASASALLDLTAGEEDLAAFAVACWQVLLWRLTGQSRVTVGLARSGRRYPELEETIGPLSRHLPLRTELEEGCSFAAVWQRAWTSLADAVQWQDYYEWQPDDETLATELFLPFCLEVQDLGPASTAAGVTFSLVEGHAYFDRFSIKPVIVRAGGAIRIELHYDALGFSREAMERMAGQFACLMEAATENPDSTIDGLEVLPAWQRQDMVDALRGQQRRLSTAACMHHLVEQQASRTPEAVAVRCEDEHMTYGELEARAGRLAHHLSCLGAGPETLVALYDERSIAQLPELFGILKTGAAFLPLDPSLPPARIQQILEDAEPLAVVTRRMFAEQLPATTAVVVVADEVPADGPRLESAGGDPRNLAYLLYTSGTTGTPKGVGVQHDQLVNYTLAVAEALELGAGTSFATVSTIAADLGHTAIFPTLCLGGTVHLVSEHQLGTPSGLADHLQRHRVDGLKIVPSHLAALLTTVHNVVPGGHLVLGGEASTWDLVERARSLRPGCRIFNHYGPTEATVGTLTSRVDNLPATGRAAVPIGRPIANTHVYVLDRFQRPVPVGALGELHIGGAGVARGYHRAPALTAEQFVPDPWAEEPGARMYRTGDMGRVLPGGDVEFIGRCDDQIKIRGFRVEPAEVTAALRRQPDVAEAFVTASRDQGEPRLVAYVVLKPGRPADPDGIRDSLKAELPGFMVPSAVVVVESLPRTPNGKVDSSTLPAPGAGSFPGALVTPRDLLELQLVGLWEEILSVRPIGVQDDFFELGGHSLLAVRLMAAIQRRFEHDLPLYILFESPTIERLAGVLRQEAPRRSWSPVVEIQRGRPEHPLFCVHAAGGNVLGYVELARHLGPEQTVYGVQAPGLDGAGSPFGRLEDMAGAYVAAMRDVQPDGPYLLAGWCMGAIVAYEIAQQLQAAGAEVALLASIDGPVARTPGQRDDDAAEDLTDAALTARFAWHYALPVAPDRIAALDPQDQLALLLRLAREADLVPPDAGLEQVVTLLDVYKSNMRAVRRYVAQPSPRSMVVFQGRDASHGLGPGLGWERLAQRVESSVLPGDHHSMLRKPDVAYLAEAVAASLRQATSRALAV